MKITKDIIRTALGNVCFMFGHEYSKRKTIVVSEHSWKMVIERLEAAGLPYTIIRVAKSPCTGEICFKK